MSQLIRFSITTLGAVLILIELLSMITNKNSVENVIAVIILICFGYVYSIIVEDILNG